MSPPAPPSKAPPQAAGASERPPSAPAARPSTRPPAGASERPPSKAAPQAPFVLQWRVCHQDTDAGGVLHHARLVELAERARSAWLRSLGMAPADLAREEGAGFAVRRIDGRWRAPARLDDLVEARVFASEAGRARIVVEHEFSVGGAPVASLRVELACVESAPDGRVVGGPRPLPARLAAAAPRRAGRPPEPDPA